MLVAHFKDCVASRCWPRRHNPIVVGGHHDVQKFGVWNGVTYLGSIVMYRSVTKLSPRPSGRQPRMLHQETRIRSVGDGH
jgi:hypothetical protein